MPEIDLKKIQPNRFNPRLEFSKAGLDELSDSIRQKGILEPIIVRRSGNDSYEVVVGERRYRAAQQAGLDTVPVILRDYTDDEVMELNLIENVQREDLSAVEKARVCKQLKERFPDRYPTWKKVAEKLGVAEDTVKKWVRTLGFPEEIQQRIAPKVVQRERVPEGKIDFGTARHIVEKIKKPEKQIEVVKEFAARHVSWRAGRQILQEIAKQPDKPVKEIFREVIDEAPIYVPFSYKHAQDILNQTKTQTTRKTKDPRLQKGSIVRAQITHFADLEVQDIYRKKLGEFNDEDAKREGGYTLNEFKQVWKALHGEWNPNESVSIITFRLARVMGELDSPRG